MYLLCLGPNKLIINENAAWAQSFNTQVYLARRSLMQLPKGFREGQDLAAQTEGTFPMSMLWNTSSRSADMTTSPLMAFWRLIRDARTTEVRRLNRISSCLNTVFIDSLYNTGYFFITCSLQKNILKQNVCQPSELLYIKCITLVAEEMCTYKFQIVVLWQFSKDICSQILNDISCGFAPLTGLTRKGQQNVVKQLKL